MKSIQDFKDAEYVAHERLRQNPSESNRLAHASAYKEMIEAIKGPGTWIHEPNFPFNQGHFKPDEYKFTFGCNDTEYTLSREQLKKYYTLDSFHELRKVTKNDIVVAENEGNLTIDVRKKWGLPE